MYKYYSVFYIQRNISLLWDLRLQVANQIADALHFLHTVNKPKSVLVHGDVKRYSHSCNAYANLYLQWSLRVW